MEPVTPRDREKRESVFLLATLENDGARSTSRHRIRNLSAHGACVEHAGKIALTDTLTVSVGRLEGIPGRVVWRDEKFVGLEFNKSINLDAARAKPAPELAHPGWMEAMQNFVDRKSNA